MVVFFSELKVEAHSGRMMSAVKLKTLGFFVFFFAFSTVQVAVLGGDYTLTCTTAHVDE